MQTACGRLPVGFDGRFGVELAWRLLENRRRRRNREALRAEAAARGREPDALDPWVFPAPKTYLKQLETAGFSIEREDCFDRPTPLPGDIDDWLTTLARPFVHAFAAGDERRDYIRAVRARLAPVLQDADGHWTAPYVRLRFVARRPGTPRFATTP